MKNAFVNLLLCKLYVRRRSFEQLFEYVLLLVCYLIFLPACVFTLRNISEMHTNIL